MRLEPTSGSGSEGGAAPGRAAVSRAVENVDGARSQARRWGMGEAVLALCSSSAPAPGC